MVADGMAMAPGPSGRCEDGVWGMIVEDVGRIKVVEEAVVKGTVVMGLEAKTAVLRRIADL